MEPEKFVVDLKDPEDIGRKLVEAKRILLSEEAKLAELRKIEASVDEWRGTVAFLESRAPANPAPEAPGRSASRPVVARVEQGANNGIGELVVEVVNREVRVIRSRDVCSILQREGHDVTPTMVSNALHYAAHRADKLKAMGGRGMYAPLAYHEAPTFDSTNGFESTSSNREAVQS
jgi:hypothetical protein